MFSQAHSFNQPIGNWTVSSVLKLGGMFHEAFAFNQPLDTWDVSSVVDMNTLFFDAVGFNQELCSWATRLPSTIDVSDAFVASGCPHRTDPRYDAQEDFLGPFCHECN